MKLPFLSERKQGEPTSVIKGAWSPPDSPERQADFREYSGTDAAKADNCSEAESAFMDFWLLMSGSVI